MKETTRTLRRLSRKSVRYWCFRFATEAAGGDSADQAPKGLKAHFEALQWFPGWRNFAVTWDVADHNCLDIRPLRESLEAAWESVVRKQAKDLPVRG